MASLLDRAAVELAPSGEMRVAINYGNPVLAYPDPVSGQPRGISVDLAEELGRRLGVSLELITFDAAGKVVDAAEAGRWDLAFLARDPERGRGIAFTAPYVVIEGTYIVHQDSFARATADLDRLDVRISVGKGAAYDLFLSRTLSQAELIRADTSAGAVDLFVEMSLEAAAGVRQPLEKYAQEHPHYRVVEGCFTKIEQAVATPKGRPAASEYLAAFVEDVKSSGFVRAALDHHKQTDASVAPPAADWQL